MFTDTHVRTDSVNRPVEVLSDEIYENMAEFTLRTLTLVRDSLVCFLDTMKAADRAKAEKVIEQVNEFLEALEKSKKASGLKKFFDALGAFGVALAMISAVLAPSPATIALVVIAIALFIEPMISAAAGQDSLIAKGTSALVEALSEFMGPEAAAVVATLLVVMVLLIVTKGPKVLCDLLKNCSSTRLQAVRQMATQLPAQVSRFLGTSVNSSKSVAFRVFLERLESLVMLAQAGVQVPMATLQYEAAVMMAEYQFDEALIAALQAILDAIAADITTDTEYMKSLERLAPELMGA